MGTVIVVVVLPSPKFLLQVVQRDEFMQVKKFISQSTIERFDEPIIGRLTGALVIELDAALVCPVVQHTEMLLFKISISEIAHDFMSGMLERLGQPPGTAAVPQVA